MSALAVALMLVVVLVAFPFRSGMYALAAIVVLRSLCDYGLIDASRVGLLSLLSTVLPLIAIVYALFLAFAGSLTAISRWIVSAGAFLVLWQLVAVVKFGVRESLMQESIRLGSILAVAAIAYAISSTGATDRLGAYAVGLAIPAFVVAAVGSVTGAPHMSINDRFAFTFSHPNSAGVFLGVAFLVALCVALSTRRTWVWVAVVAALILLGMTASLTSFFATAVGGTAVVASSRQLSGLRKIQFGVFGLVAFVAIVQVLGISERFDEFAESSKLTNSPDSFQWRLENWRLLLEQWNTARLVGFGTGSTNSIVSPLGGPPHNVYVQLLVEYGIVGICALLLLVVVVTRKSLRVARSGAGTLSSAPLALTVFMAVNALAGNTLGYTAAVYLAASVFGLAFGEDVRLRIAESSQSKMRILRRSGIHDHPEPKTAL
jgi:O-antigen ligase